MYSKPFWKYSCTTTECKKGNPKVYFKNWLDFTLSCFKTSRERLEGTQFT
jgi:hypothetical protein